MIPLILFTVNEEVDNNQVSQTFYSAEEGVKWLEE